MDNFWDWLSCGVAGMLFGGAMLTYVDAMNKLKIGKPLKLPVFYRTDVLILGFYVFINATSLVRADRDWRDWWVTSLASLGFVLVVSVWIISRDASRATKLEIRRQAARHVKKGRTPTWLPMN